jgi:chitodextrinase
MRGAAVVVKSGPASACGWDDCAASPERARLPPLGHEAAPRATDETPMQTSKALATIAAATAALLGNASAEAARIQTAPVNTSPPTAAGSAVVGQTVSGSVGTWTGTAIKYAPQWMRCDSVGANCAKITGATLTTYVVTNGDVSSRLRFVVVATNKNGSTTASAAPTDGVVNTALDVLAPSAPTAVTPVGATQTSVSLSWNPSSDNVGVAGYDISIGGVRAGQTTSSSYTVTGLTCGTTYTFGVAAFDAATNRSTVATASGSTTACPDTQAPSTPSGLTASAGAATLTPAWSPSSDNVGIAGYGVYVGGVFAGSATGTSYTLSGLSCGTSYSVAVDAFDAAGNRSPKAVVSASTTSCSPTASTTPSSSIYWGAFMEAQQTYNYYYGGTWGNVPWDLAAWDRFESNAGKRVSIDHYGQPPSWEQPFSASTASQVTNRGALPLIDTSSKSVALTDIANGAYDSSLTSWAQAVKAWGKPFFFRWNWEMNGTWFPWGAQAAQNPAAYIAAWRHFHDLTTQAGATNITWVWCPNLEYTGSTPYEQLYPGDAYVDWTCLDGYNSAATSTTFATLYTQSYNHLLKLAPTKPIMIGETGSKEYAAGTKATWITDLLTTLPKTFPQIKALVWFNWRIYENGTWWDWPIESSPSTQTAFATGITNPYYAPANTTYTNLPPLTKIKPL